MAQTYSPSIIPYDVDPETGFTQCKDIQEVARQNLLMVILTSPGERIWEANFGVGLKLYLFENDTPQLRSTLRRSIISQAGRYIPYVRINKVDFSASSPDENMFSVVVNYTVKVTGTSETLAITSDSTSGTPTLQIAVNSLAVASGITPGVSPLQF